MSAVPVANASPIRTSRRSVDVHGDVRNERVGESALMNIPAGTRAAGTGDAIAMCRYGKARPK